MKWNYFKHEKAYELTLSGGYIFGRLNSSFILDVPAFKLSFFMQDILGNWKETEIIEYDPQNKKIIIKKCLHKVGMINVEVTEIDSSKEILPYRKVLSTAEGLDEESNGLVKLILEKLERLPRSKK